LQKAEEIDAVVVGCVPMTPVLSSMPDELSQPGSIAQRIQRLFAESHKPLVFVVDCAGPYDELARTVRAAGVPVFRSADQAVRSVGRYFSYRTGKVRP
jgi:acyl-CoA synthetase (NDP forming)